MLDQLTVQFLRLEEKGCYLRSMKCAEDLLRASFPLALSRHGGRKIKAPAQLIVPVSVCCAISYIGSGKPLQSETHHDLTHHFAGWDIRNTPPYIVHSVRSEQATENGRAPNLGEGRRWLSISELLCLLATSEVKTDTRLFARESDKKYIGVEFDTELNPRIIEASAFQSGQTLSCAIDTIKLT
jgi:hypothetical protein